MQPANCKRSTSRALTRYYHLFYKKDRKILFITSTVFTFKPAYNQDTGVSLQARPEKQNRPSIIQFP